MKSNAVWSGPDHVGTAMHDPLDTHLRDFAAIGLGSLDDRALLDRSDTKYLLPASSLAALLADLADDYRILEINGTRIHRYETRYFDTPSFDCYRRHHAGRAVRCKIRVRRYLASADRFIEVKCRDVHGRTRKHRLPLAAEADPFVGRAGQMVQTASGFGLADLRPALDVGYSRVTLVGISTPDRVTLDTSLACRATNATAEFAGLVIAEVKRPRAASSSTAVAALRRQRIREARLSKYCVGLAATRHDLPRNNFLPVLRSLDRVLHDVR